ncbi:N-acetylglucosamine kinase [Streptomyces rochei]|uniref:N-acetylglucosamine kinase n=1 Tax=Streptomyces rochei TaxID=1928 RepID=UPI0022EA0C26|nr:BadF/BadG/BcrA/BcrD ATPase family protein [Streptomyces rochei]MCC8450343.1 ATPase [Streptomyces rochei]
MTAAVAVDLGKTGCRAVLWTGANGPSSLVREVQGAPGLASADGVEAARVAVRTAVLPLIAEHAPSRLSALCVGAAGAAAAPEAARALAELLLEDLPTDEAAVTSDAITAHAGALGARPGVVLAIGTGSVAIGIGEDGSYARVDGWGPWLGDEGSGAWIGTAGLRAALRAHDGRGPDTALLAAAVRRFGSLDALPAVLAAGGNPARFAASFAPEVAHAAESGDAIADVVVRDAATALGETVLAAADRITGDDLPVAVTGGLSGLGEPLMAPQESHVVRVRRTTPPYPVPTTPVSPPAAA